MRRSIEHDLEYGQKVFPARLNKRINLGNKVFNIRRLMHHPESQHQIDSTGLTGQTNVVRGSAMGMNPLPHTCF